MNLQKLKDYNISGIYRIYNKLDGKSYIGQSKNIAMRIRMHLRSTINETVKDYNVPIHAAMRKYGIDNFEFELIEKCDAKELNKREIFWIAKFNTYIHANNSSGYNLTEGGKQSVRLIKLTPAQAKEIQQLLISAKSSAKEIASMYNVGVSLINRINTGKA